MIPVECLDNPCMGTLGPDFEWWRMVALFIGFNGLGYTCFKAVILFNDWRSQWRRR